MSTGSRIALLAGVALLALAVVVFSGITSEPATPVDGNPGADAGSGGGADAPPFSALKQPALIDVWVLRWANDTTTTPQNRFLRIGCSGWFVNPNGTLACSETTGLAEPAATHCPATIAPSTGVPNLYRGHMLEVDHCRCINQQRQAGQLQPGASCVNVEGYA